MPPPEVRGLHLVTGDPIVEPAPAIIPDPVSAAAARQPIGFGMRTPPQAAPPSARAEVPQPQASAVGTSPEDSRVTDEIDRASGGDRDRADKLGKALSELQEALDVAIMSGLVVEPEFKVLSNRFAAIGVTADSYLVKVEVYRKLV